MKIYKFNRRDRRFAPWAALCVLSLVGAMVFALPSVVFAQTFELSQDCATAKVEDPHTITGTVTNGDVPVPNVLLVFTILGDENNPTPMSLSSSTNADGIAEITYTRSNSGVDKITLMAPVAKGTHPFNNNKYGMDCRGPLFRFTEGYGWWPAYTERQEAWCPENCGSVELMTSM